MGKEKDIISRIIDNFPPIFQVQKGMLIHELFSAFSAEMDLIDGLLSYVFSSHMVDYADLKSKKRPDDLQKIGAMFGITPEHGETAENFRKRLKKSIEIYLSGLGTADAIIKMTALAYQMEVDEDKIVRGNSASPFITTAVLTDTGGGAKEEIEIRLIDNPENKIDSDPVGIYPNLVLEVWNNGLFEVVPQIEIRTGQYSLLNPGITNTTTGQQLIYSGTIPKETVFIAKAAPDGESYNIRIGNSVVKNDCILQGDIFNTGTFDYSSFARKGRAIVFPRGPSIIHLNIRTSMFDSALFDERVFSTKSVGQFDWKSFDECAFSPTNPMGSISFSWVERKPAAFKLEIPIGLFLGELEKTRKLIKVISKVKAAGVEASIGTNNILSEEKLIPREGSCTFGLSARHAEMVPMKDKLEGTETKTSALAEKQNVEERVLFKGTFDMTRLETSIFN